MKLKIGTAVAGAVMLSAATVWGTAGAASAVNWDHVYSGSGMKVYVEEHGDIVSVCDTAADGDGADLYVRVVGELETRYSLTVTNGKGSCKTAKASRGGKWNLPEGSLIDLELGWGGSNYSFRNDH